MKSYFSMKSAICIVIFGFIFLIMSCSNNKSSQTEKDPLNEKTDSLESIYLKEIVRTHNNGEKARVQYFDTTSGGKELKFEIRYFENGNKEMEGAYLNKKRNGKWIAWYDNGVVWSIGYYNEGLKNGSSKVYYPNGEVRYEKHYVNDTAEGAWLFYNENGEPIGKAIYEKGELIEELPI
jgi:antitoxin component YwqK of YwqJK toxin-antitoxin module